MAKHLAMLVGMLGCGRQISPERPAVTQLGLVPHVEAHDQLRFRVHVEMKSESRVDGQYQLQDAELDVEDVSEVVSIEADGTFVIVERFEGATVGGNLQLADELRRAASELASASVTTRFTADARTLGSVVGGNAGDETRTLLGNLAPLVSFRFMPRRSVAIGDEWDSRWTDTLETRDGRDTGAISTVAHYRLQQVQPCGVAKCAVLAVRGSDDIPAAADQPLHGHSEFRGMLEVEVTTLRPISKRVESTTTLAGDRDGLAFEIVTSTSLVAQRE